MKAKVVLLARLKDEEGKYPFVPVPFRQGRPKLVEGLVTGYYLRYSEAGKRITKALGKNLDEAFTAYQNEELNQARVRLGLAIPNGNSNRVRIADAVKQYLD
jgi:hypothetical protein